jgi:CBS domain-containing protein
VDVDDETQRPMVVSVITQYRILKFIAINATATDKLKKPLNELNVGTYDDVLSATMDTPVIDVIHMLVKKSISSVPIVDKEGKAF